MKQLKNVEHLDFDMCYDDDGHMYYKLRTPIQYISHRFNNKTCTVPIGFYSDGASGPATDVVSKAWWVHDWNCDINQGGGKWDDGSVVTPYESSYNLYDILMKEGRWIRARPWWLATFLWQSWREWRKDKRQPPPPAHLAIPLY